MSLVVSAERAVSVLRLTDEVLNEKSLLAALRVLDAPGISVVHLDLGAVRLPTAEGLGLLVSLNRDLYAHRGGLVLFNVPADTYEVFKATRLVTVLDVRPQITPNG